MEVEEARLQRWARVRAWGDLRVMAQSGSCKCNEKAWGGFGLEGGHLT